MNFMWFMRASNWARRPPSWGRVKLVLAVIAVCILLFVVERYVGWPDWMTTEGPRGGRILR
ncbi:hypothetical protein EKE94_04070 [Mesobaculum littorinae]|uniref:Uncharacterized protein n=1 Tax=Mesobaculum littorinae TaxID=2486419 RepID=A0A438ALX8_9RHOB|nr:hypothetical protein [Mesobaculum littorinae]RVV99853.1 hypothetical protein EKE94_04070 [Mesobaculum littorinae]